MSTYENRGSFKEASRSELNELGDRPASESEGEDTEAEADADEPVSRPNTYREEDWEEGPARIVPASNEPEPRRRFQLEGASSEEIEEAEAQMLADLTCEAYDHSKDCFEAARGIDDGVGARSRKLALGCRLATLTMQLVAASDKHRKAMKES
jgi:hypothetical protein